MDRIVRTIAKGRKRERREDEEAVLDAAGNLIARIGAWGNAAGQGPPGKYPLPEVAFGWGYSSAAGGDALYASDKDVRRIVKVRLDYREVTE
ncbi:MAG: hypothetical protein QM844_19675, partial [Planctomycetota bacterium]|nr:hypothetical protein [Planctomycetota bacterium]